MMCRIADNVQDAFATLAAHELSEMAAAREASKQ